MKTLIWRSRALFALSLGTLAVAAAASNIQTKASADPSLPPAALRTLGQNYADIVLAECVAAAYGFDDRVAKDAHGAAVGFDAWSYFYLEEYPDRIATLVKDTLAKRYPSFQGEPMRLDLMKCIDMYHGPELAAQVRSLGDWGDKTYEDVEREENKQLERGDDAK